MKAINDTSGLGSIVPSALEFGEFPSIGACTGPKVRLATFAKRAGVAQEARKRISKYLEQVRVMRTERRRTTKSTDLVYQSCD